jgi:diguanylate cyclase (GGDEF)-like protein/PAS domain S-box-containing protein
MNQQSPSRPDVPGAADAAPIHTAPSESGSPSDIEALQKNNALLERRLLREKNARQAAEQLLNDKSLELFTALQHSSQAQRTLELALWASGESIWQWQAEDDSYQMRSFPDSNQPAKCWIGTATAFLQRVHPNDSADVAMQWYLHQSGAASLLDLAFRFSQADGRWLWIRMRGQAIERNAQQQALRIVGTAKDITVLREAEHSFRLMASAFASSRDAMLILNQDLHIIEANQAFFQLARLAPEPLQRQTLAQFIPLSGDELQLMQQHGALKLERQLHTAGGLTLPTELTLSQFLADDGQLSYLIATIRDISERKKAERELARLARFDSLTGLPNRHSFAKQLAQQLRESDSAVAVYFIDLDGFKAVNDSFGHQAGDELLKHIASLLVSRLPASTLLARWGGDEFVAATPLTGRTEPDASTTPDWAHHAQTMLQLIRDCKQSVQGHQLLVSASIGVALSPEHGTDVDLLLRHADAAMYEAKAQGKNAVALYHQGLTADAMQKVTLLSELKQAIEQDKLDFVLQAKFSAQRAIVGAELLCRWHSPLHGTISPAVFIPLAEQHGLAPAIGILALEHAARALNILRGHGFCIPIAVNISPHQMLDKQFVSQLTALCQRMQITPQEIELEVTESVFMQDSADVEARLQALQAAQFRIAMDDFGTGYSSLSYLRRFTFDVVKIDRSFVQDLTTDAKAAQLMSAIVAMCRALDIETVAEGVETEGQLQLLKQQGVGCYQGYLLARPLPLADFIRLLLQ